MREIAYYCSHVNIIITSMNIQSGAIWAWQILDSRSRFKTKLSIWAG